MKALALLLILLALAVVGCAATEDDPIDPEDAPFDLGKADGACLSSPTSDDARGIVMLASDPQTTVTELHAAGLHWYTAHAIVDARPFADLASLDAVKTVGPIACRILRDHACLDRGLCEPSLDVWTWNVEHFPLADGTIDAVTDTMTNGPAELIGFEEVDSLPAFDQLLAGLPEWKALTGRTGFDTRVAIAYRTDRLEVVSREDLFPDDPDRFPRPPLAVTFDVRGRAGSVRFTMVVVHLKAMIDDASRDRRRRAVIALEQWLAERRANDERVIVVGDWNDDIDAPAPDNVFLPLLDRPDAYTALTLPVAERHEVSYLPFHRLIDHVVMTHEAARDFLPLAVDPVELDTTIPDYIHAVSDHRPVHASLVPIVPRQP